MIIFLILLFTHATYSMDIKLLLNPETQSNQLSFAGFILKNATVMDQAETNPTDKELDLDANSHKIESGYSRNIWKKNQSEIREYMQNNIPKKHSMGDIYSHKAYGFFHKCATNSTCDFFVTNPNKYNLLKILRLHLNTKHREDFLACDLGDCPLLSNVDELWRHKARKHIEYCKNLILLDKKSTSANDYTYCEVAGRYLSLCSICNDFVAVSSKQKNITALMSAHRANRCKLVLKGQQ